MSHKIAITLPSEVHGVMAHKSVDIEALCFPDYPTGIKFARNLIDKLEQHLLDRENAGE